MFHNLPKIVKRFNQNRKKLEKVALLISLFFIFEIYVTSLISISIAKILSVRKMLLCFVFMRCFESLQHFKDAERIFCGLLDKRNQTDLFR